MIELNGIQISDNNINTKKNVKIYVDEKQLDSKVGELSDLKTTNKSSIVNAINEIKDTTDTLQVDVNRIYSDFTIIPNTPTEQEFTYKKSDEGVIEKGVAVIDKVKGNSVVWNQLIKDFREPSNWLTNNCDVTAIGDKIHIKFTSASSSSSFGVKSSAFYAGHKYCVLMNNENAIPLTAIKLGSASGVGTSGSTLNLNPPTITIAIPKDSADDGALWFWPSDETKLEGDFSNIYVIDLTQMFGAGNEPTTYEEFLSRKPKVADEYAYNEGTIVNNKVEKVVTTGRNLFDSSTAIDGKTILDTSGTEVNNSLGWCSTFIPIIGGKSYFCKGVTINVQGYGVHCYDKDKQHIKGIGVPQKGMTFDAPINAKYIRIHGIYADSPANTVILNLSDASFNGQYAPYEKHELDLSWIKEIKNTEGVKLFEDGLKSVGTVFDEVGKNKVVKRIGVVDLGTLPWNTSWWDGDGRLYVSLDNKKVGTTNIVYPLGPTLKYDGVLVNAIGICGNINNSYVYIGDAKTHSSASEFISSLSGVYAYYELAEPIEVEYDEKNLTYPVVAGGTEEAIASEPSTHMRASITYGSNTVATILSLMNRVNELERKIKTNNL